MIKYTIQNLEENYSIVAEDVEKYLKANELKIGAFSIMPSAIFSFPHPPLFEGGKKKKSI